MLTRRSLLAGISWIALSAAANAWPAHGLPTLVKRSLLNMNFPTGDGLYKFIDHVRDAGGFGPFNASFTNGTVYNRSILDANGWPNSASANGQAFGSGMVLPGSSNFAGPYVIVIHGNGRLQFTNGTWTEAAINTPVSVASAGVNAGTCTATPANWTKNSNGDWSVTSPGSPTLTTIVVTLSGGGTAPITIPFEFISTDPLATGDYVTGFSFYRLEDLLDFNAGLVFRKGFKQPIVNLNPGCIRFMDWTGGNNDPNFRFENRPSVNYPGWTSLNYKISLPYGRTSGASNQYTLTAVSGTPASMQNGELVQCQIGTGLLRGGGANIIAVTKANPCKVTTAANTPHGYQTGDIVQQIFTAGAGMGQLSYQPCIVTVIDAFNYTLANVNSVAIDSTSFTTFVYFGADGNQSRAGVYVTLQVGSGNDRVAYPVLLLDTNQTPASAGAASWISTNDYKTFIFDKSIVGTLDASGNPVLGAWLATVGGAGAANNAYNPQVPLEICAKLIVELNALSTAGPIHMWLNIPHMGLCSMDADYTAGSEYASNAINVVLNGANGYPGIPAKSHLYVELSNETWTDGSFDKAQPLYYGYRGYLRWPTSGQANHSNFATLRTLVIQNDVKNAGFYLHPQVRFLIAGQGVAGVSGTNSTRLFGNTFINTDAANPIGGAAPISALDHFAVAAYFDADPSFVTANLLNYSNQWLADAGNAAAQEADCALFVNGIIAAAQQGTTLYSDTLMPAYATAVAPYGKTAVNYEGGLETTLASTYTTNEKNYLVAVKQSQAWANAQRAYFSSFPNNKNLELPGVYIEIDPIGGSGGSFPTYWGYAAGDTYAAGVEGAGLDKTWTAMSGYNVQRP